jgi:glycosyltransferase involved in cell wall biosynthesis
MSLEIQPVISVVIPVHNGAAFLGLCLKGLLTADSPSYECIVVNDGSTDGTREIANKFPIRIVDVPGGPRGPAYARNRGGEAARGAILFFLDADIVLAPGGLQRVGDLFAQRADVAAVFGSYDAHPAAPGLISRYRNLLHHFVHQSGNEHASTFWAGCGAIRKSVFEKIGGFDETRFSRPSIEDIELGYRLKELGFPILLDKELQGKHLKAWTFYSMIRTDVVCRAIPWSRLILKTRKLPDDLNLKVGQRVSFVLAAFACVSLVLAAVHLEWLGASAAATLGVVALNRNLYTFFFRRWGILFAVGCVALHLLYYLYSGLSYFYVRVGFEFSRAMSFPRILALKQRRFSRAASRK